MGNLKPVTKAEAVAICKVLRLDYRGSLAVQAKAERRASTFARMLREYVDEEIRAKRC
jgi:hypothetical protein